MSKVKSPKEKKNLSLQKDRRNVYGECPTSSRKNIRRGKQRSHMEQRRAANKELKAAHGALAEIDQDAVEGRVKDRIAVLRKFAFKKAPDAPLAVVLERNGRRPVDPSVRRKSR